MRVLLLTGIIALLAASEVSWADDSPAGQARVLSLDDRLPDHLRYEVKRLAQEFKKDACRVPWKTAGPVKHAFVRGKNGRIPGWKVGKGKKAIFVGHKDRRCDFAIFRAPGRHGDASAYNREINSLLSQRVKPVVKARNTAMTGVLTTLGGGIVGGLAIADEAGTVAPKPVGVGIGASMVLTGTLLTHFGARAINKNAAIVTLKRRKAQGKKQRKIAKSRAKNCFDKSLKRYIAQPSTTVFALSSCHDLEAIMHPGIWDFGKVSDKHPAELAVRAANQIQALGGLESRHSRVSECLAAKPTTKNKYTESCRKDGNQALPLGLQQASSCRSLLDELSALGSSGRKMYPIKDMRRAVEAQEKAVAKARKTGQEWREDKNAACAQIARKKKAIDDLCLSKYSRRKTPITSTFECKSTGLVKTRPMVYDPGYVPFLGERGEVQLAPSVKIDRCLLFPSPRLPTNCDAWHRLR